MHLILATLVLSSTLLAASAAVTTKALGPVSGIACNATGSTYKQYLGIPFAAPPVGVLRWAPPQAYVPTTNGTGFNATKNGHACIQGPFLGAPPPADTSEDCLFLDIYAPATTPNAPLPVRVFIHGGGQTSGGANFPAYYACPTAEQTTSIVVVIQYRLDVFGFLTHPSLKTASGIQANWALQDQQFALKWVQDNIASWGGDPARVGIFGESSGGDAMFVHLVAPGSNGTFSSVVVESGAALDLAPLDFDQQTGATFAQNVNCTQGDIASCLRNVSAIDILAASPESQSSAYSLTTAVKSYGSGMHFTYDKLLIPQQVQDAMAAGAINRSPSGATIPVLAGTNADEARLFSPQTPLTTANYTTFLSEYDIPADQIANVSALYPISAYPASYAALLAIADIQTDRFFACPTRRALKLLQTNGNPAYEYLFSQTVSCDFIQGVSSLILGSSHYSEIPFVFGNSANLTVGSNCTLSSAETTLSRTIGNAWTSMVTEGHPAAGWPAFPAYGEFNTNTTNAGGLTVVQSGGKDDWWNLRCPIWDAINDNATYHSSYAVFSTTSNSSSNGTASSTGASAKSGAMASMAGAKVAAVGAASVAVAFALWM
ncbi:hypothetical protein HKX48_006980 [Thoreauomyces humboldtii]|nr:hypothetical protein HKX48_006980 [Thoreauomyces humboldtii]